MGEIAVQSLPGTVFLETLVSREAVALQHAGAWLEEVVVVVDFRCRCSSAS
jgi:hypothetical protein